MAIPSTPLPDYTIQQPDLLANLGKMVQLKNMLGEEKELPLNLQLKQQQVAQSQQQTQQQQALAPSQQQEPSARASSATSQAAMNDRPEVAAGATGLLDDPDQFDSDPSESASNDYRVERMLGIDPSDPLAAAVRGQSP